MGTISVLLVTQVAPYLEQQLNKRYKLFRLWDYPQKPHFFTQHAASIRALVGRSTAGADSELIDALPNLEIISSSSVGVDKIDLVKCKEKGIRVTNTPDVLTDEVADLTIGLILALLRRICECDRYVRCGNWKRGDYKLTTKVNPNNQANWIRYICLIYSFSSSNYHLCRDVSVVFRECSLKLSAEVI